MIQRLWACFYWAVYAHLAFSRGQFSDGIQVVAEGSTMQLCQNLCTESFLLICSNRRIDHQQSGVTETEHPHLGLIQHLIVC